MAHTIRQCGDDWNKQAGTSNQTGNSAPKFPWADCDVGRCARIAVLCCAYRLGYLDDRMARLHEFPSERGLFDLFHPLFPWFGQVYNYVIHKKVQLQNYTGATFPYGPEDVHNRLRYCFAKPGSKRHSKRARAYGISVEHPSAPEQAGPMGRRVVWAKCSTILDDRIEKRRIVAIEEAEDWGAYPEGKAITKDMRLVKEALDRIRGQEYD